MFNELYWPNKEEWYGDACSTNEGEKHVGFCWENLRERKYLQDLGLDGRMILNSESRNWFRTWIALIWLRIGTGGMLLWERRWTFRFHKMRANSWLAAKLLCFQQFLRCVEFFKVENTEPDAPLATRSTALCSPGAAGLWNSRQVSGQIRSPTWHLRPQILTSHPLVVLHL